MTWELGNICGGGQEGELSGGLGAQTLALRNIEDGGEVRGSGVGLGLLRARGRSDSFCCWRIRLEGGMGSCMRGVVQRSRRHLGFGTRRGCGQASGRWHHLAKPASRRHGCEAVIRALQPRYQVGDP